MKDDLYDPNMTLGLHLLGIWRISPRSQTILLISHLDKLFRVLQIPDLRRQLIPIITNPRLICTINSFVLTILQSLFYHRNQFPWIIKSHHAINSPNKSPDLVA